MVTKEDIERLQENLKAAIMRDDWAMCDLLVKQISEASEQLRQPTPRASDGSVVSVKCDCVEFMRSGTHDARCATRRR